LRNAIEARIIAGAVLIAGLEPCLRLGQTEEWRSMRAAAARSCQWRSRQL